MLSALMVVAALAVAACGSGDGTRDEPASRRTGDRDAPLAGSITVSAAASLVDVFTELRDRFVRLHPGVDVRLNFGSSGQLAEQIINGAPVDVVAFADSEPMDRLGAEGLLADPATTFARNRLAIITKPENPGRIETPADLRHAATVALCVVTAPCGRYADEVLAAAGATPDPSRVTRSSDARATLTAVSVGDADAGIVYITDAAAAGDSVSVVAMPSAVDVSADYPIATLSSATARALADAFLVYVTHGDGPGVLRDAGFLVP